MNNLPNRELEMALLELLNALKNYNIALQSAGREGNELVFNLVDMLSNELTNEPDRQNDDDEASREKSQEN